MFQEPNVFAGAGIGIATGTQPGSYAPTLTPGIHLRWASAPHRGVPWYGHYLLRRPSSAGATKPVSINTDEGAGYVASTETDFGTPPPDGTTGTGPFGTFEFTFTDRSDIDKVDVLFTSGQSGGTTVTATTDDGTEDSRTIAPGTTPRQTVSVTGDPIRWLSLEGDLGLIIDVRLHSALTGRDRGWSFLPGVDQPLSLPLAHPDYPASTAPTTLDEARTVAASRVHYGPPTRFAGPSEASTGAGTVDLTANSPLVTGQETTWDDDQTGAVFRVDGDDDAYTVLAVLAPDRLVLSRSYREGSRTDVPYTLGRDHFGAVHDALATLVTDGAATGGTAARAVPHTVVDGGTVERTAGETTVTGQGTAWDASMAGLGLQVARPTAGTVALTPGSKTVNGVGTDWTESLTGSVFVVSGQRTRYEVAAVVDSNTLELDRPYVGPLVPSGNAQEYTMYERSVARVARVTSATSLELADLHAGESHTSGRAYRLVALAGDVETGVLSAQYPAETLAVASLDPAMCQLLGSYWVDEDAVPNTAYDYLLVADHTGVVDVLADSWNVESGDASDFQGFVGSVFAAAASDSVDGYLLEGLVREDTDPPLPAEPSTVRVYDLPESTATGTDTDRYAAGLQWDHGRVDGRLPTDGPAMYYLWRETLGETPGSGAPSIDAYDALGRDGPVSDVLADGEPVLVSSAAAEVELPGWPATTLDTVDGRRPPGWYSYRVSGVDMFGRHTPLSDPATWVDPETGQRRTHATEPTAPEFAVELRSRLPPPPPAGVTASVLDPQDPDSADSDARAWWAEHGEGVALRIEWTWPAAFAAQAPDTDGFDCHVTLGSLNSHPGRITTVNEGQSTTRVTTSLSHTRDPSDPTTPALSPGAFAGGSLHVAGAQFTVVDSGGGSGLWVDVLPREGPDGPVTPATDVDCAVAVPAVFSRGTATVVDGDDVVTGRGTGWVDALVGQPFRLASTGDRYTVAAVESATRLRLDRPYDAPANRDDREAVSYAIDHPASTDYSEASSWTFDVADVDIDAHTTQTADGGRRYETTVPAPGANGGGFDPGVGPDEEPVVHANVGVSAYIDAPDGTMRGAVGGPAPVTRVHRTPPDPPTVPPLDSEIDWASRPDYDRTACYTVRWETPPAGVRAHVYRAMDRTLFRVDWERRGSEATDIAPEDVDLFPPTLRTEDAAETARRGEIVTELTTALDVATFADAEATYESLAPDALQTLAALPGNEAAFTQVTVEPLSAEDAPNVRGPDYEPGDPGPGTQPGVDGVPATMPPGDDLCAYVDGFDGRSRNRYLYRVGSVDAAHNRGDSLGYPTPPTKARDGVAPERPVVTSIAAGRENGPGDRCLTLRWNATRAEGVAQYRVFRTADADAVRDVRLMTERARVELPLSPDDPFVGMRDGPAAVWTDDDCDAGVDYHYRLVAESETGLRSEASASVAGRAFDRTPPTPPALTSLDWVRISPDGTTHPYDDPVPAGERWTPAVQARWDDADGLNVLLERAETGGSSSFAPVSAWHAETEAVDEEPPDRGASRYRLRVLDERGRSATGSPTTLAPPGGP